MPIALTCCSNFCGASPIRRDLVVRGDTLWRVTDGQLSLLSRVRRCYRRFAAESLPAAAFNALSRGFAALPGFGPGSDGLLHAWRKATLTCGAVMSRWSACRYFCSETVFEALITLIIEQHISWKSAMRSQRELLRLAGCSLPGQGRCRHMTSRLPARLGSAPHKRGTQAAEDHQQAN